MTVLDWGIAVLFVAAVLWSLRGGLIAAALTLALLGAFLWAIGAVALHGPVSAQLRRDVQRSLIFRNLYDALPPSEGMIDALKRVDPGPLLDLAAAPVGPPDSAIARDPEVRAAGAAVVRVIGTACGLGVVGSGWVAAPGLVVTNAHVVAGSDDITVEAEDGDSYDAAAVHYEPRNDVAVLAADTGLAPLALAAEPTRGAAGAVLGYPESGPFAIAAARYGGEEEVISQDSYGRGPIPRGVVTLRGLVRKGNSGGPLVNAAGRVLGTVFAARTSGSPGGYAVPNDVVRRALRDSASAVDTGSCVG